MHRTNIATITATTLEQQLQQASELVNKRRQTTAQNLQKFCKFYQAISSAIRQEIVAHLYKIHNTIDICALLF